MWYQNCYQAVSTQLNNISTQEYHIQYQNSHTKVWSIANLYFIPFQIADNLTVADSLKNVFENTCQEEARLNTATSNNDTVAEAAKLADAIASQICINQCSGHGTCQNGTCQCDSGMVKYKIISTLIK